MIKQFKILTAKEWELLLKAPVLVSVLAASSGHEINQKQKADAIKLAHLKTFTARPILLEYYSEVEKHFVSEFEATVKKYSPLDDANREKLLEEINEVNLVIDKFDEAFAAILRNSLSGYATHVRRAGHVVVEDFMFPFELKNYETRSKTIRL